MAGAGPKERGSTPSTPATTWPGVRDWLRVAARPEVAGLGKVTGWVELDAVGMGGHVGQDILTRMPVTASLAML